MDGYTGAVARSMHNSFTRKKNSDVFRYCQMATGFPLRQNYRFLTYINWVTASIARYQCSRMFSAIAEKHTLISLQVWSLPLAAPIAPWLWLHTAFEWKPSMTSAQFIQNDKHLNIIRWYSNKPERGHIYLFYSLQRRFRKSGDQLYQCVMEI